MAASKTYASSLARTADATCHDHDTVSDGVLGVVASIKPNKKILKGRG